MEYKKIFILIIFLSLIAFNFACDCSQCKTISSTESVTFQCSDCPSDCNSKCKWFLINSTTAECLSCDTSGDTDDIYYARVLTSKNIAFCKKLGITGFPYAKIIKGTHQIVDDCKELGLLELGDECMQQNAIFEYDDYKDGDPIIDGNAETKELHCIYNYYIETQPNGLNYYKCLQKDDICANHGYNYFDSKTNECLNKCPKSQKKITKLEKDGKTYYRCSEECDYIDEDGNKYDKKYSKNSCFDSSIHIDYCYKDCPDESRYYFDNDKECRENCYDNDHKNYFILPDGRCSNNLFDCDQTYYFLVNADKNFFKCEEKSKDKTGCHNSFPYRYEHENRIFCLSNCNDKTHVFFGTNQNECIIDPNKMNYDYNTLEIYKYGNDGALGCKEYQYIYENNDVKICFDKCEGSYFPSFKENNKCVTSSTEQNCPNIYYKDITRGIKVCLQNNNCVNQIPYLIESENICNETCNGVLSLDGKKCYNVSLYENCGGNSIQTVKNGQRQCFCQYKYYYNGSTNRESLICLENGKECESSIPLLINETNECVKHCPYKEFPKKYENFCVRECPKGFEDSFDICICNLKHYTIDNKLICTDICPDDRSLIANENQCLSNCNEAEGSFPYYFEGICYPNCSIIPYQGLEEKQISYLVDEETKNALNGKYGIYSDKICLCKGVWYEEKESDKYVYNCDNETTSTCNNFKNSYKFLIYSTKQCVKECPGALFYFNNKCYSSCDKANTVLGKTSIIQNGNTNQCICEDYWRYNNNEIECLENINNKICIIDEDKTSYLLINDTKECYKGTECRKEYPKLFDRKCYKECPGNSNDLQGIANICQCKYYWYVNKTDILNETICLSKDESCPDNYPNLIVSQRKCVEDNDDELTDKFQFNREYYDIGCPANSIIGNTNKNICVCNPALGYWYQKTIKKKDNTDLKIYNCSLRGCPENYILADKKTKECSEDCNTYTYNEVCYNECPEMTEKNDEQHICELKKEYNNIEEVKEKIINSSVIVDLYYSAAEGKDSEGIIEVKNGDSVDYIIEYYGLNPNKDYYKSKHNNNKNSLSSSLSYIDLSECINNIYKDNGMNSTDDIIVVKFDLVDTPKEYLINPVEYKFFHPVNGKELDMSACYNKKIKISYPFSNILKNYKNNFKKLRHLETVILDIQSDDITSLIEKYNIAKQINGEHPDIDIFNSNDKIYTNYCSSIQVNGIDLTIEDRINSLFPHYALCEQNCSYNHTDYNEERIYCDCTLKTEFDIERDHPENVVINENAINISQHGNTNFPVIRCISVWKKFSRILQTIPFYYHIIVLIIEIILLILTLVFGMKNMQNYFQNRICNLNNIDDDFGLEINEKKNLKSKKQKSGYIKTTERNLDNPPKRNNVENKDNKEDNNEIQFIPDEFIFLYFNDSDKGVRKQIEKKFVPFEVNKNTKVLLQKMKGVDYKNVNASGPFKSDQNILELIDSPQEELISVNENNSANNKANQETIYKKKEPKTYFINDNDELVEDKKYDVEVDDLTCLEKFRIEQRLLRKEFEVVQYKQENGFFFLMLAEILDKIYITKIVLFRQDYDIIYINLSIYLLYHVFLVNIIAMFFDMKTIQKIWRNENYPGFGLYLGYGLASILICWIVYIILTCLMTNKGKYNEILDIKKSKKKDNKMKLVDKKFFSLKRKTKIKIALYSIIQYILIIFFTIYSVTLCAIFYGTMKKIYLNYVIALLEVLVIKILYGLVLSILRQVSLSKEKKGLYNVVLFMDNYIV